MKRLHAPVVIVLSALAVAACSRPEAPPEPVRAVRTMTVPTGVTGGAHEYAADVRARVESRLSFRVGGKVVRRAVELGQTVRKGQVLAELDPQDLRLGQDAARAAERAADVNLALAAADFKRYKELRDQGFISSAELERRETALKAAQAQLEQARAQAGVQVNQAGYSVLVSDVAGIVTGVDVEVGAVVAAGTPIVRVAADGPRDVVFAVPEDRVAAMRASLGRPGAMQVRLWDAGTALLPATLRELSAAADPVTRTFQAKADVAQAPVRLGQTATVVVPLPKTEGVAKLPLTAVMAHQGGSAVWVYEAASSTVKQQPIVVAGADGNEVVVASGVAPGQVIVTAGVHTLTPGQKVTLYGAAKVSTAPAAAGSAASASR